MSNTTKATVAVVALVVILAGGYWFVSSQTAPEATTVVATTPNPVSVSSTSGASTLPSGTQTSNQALGQDLSAIDTQLSGLNSDNANVSQSVNDQQVPQSSL